MLSERSFMKMKNRPYLGPIPGVHQIVLGLDLRLGHLLFFLLFFTLWKLAFGRFQSQIGRLCAGLFVVVD